MGADCQRDGRALALGQGIVDVGKRILPVASIFASGDEPDDLDRHVTGVEMTTDRRQTRPVAIGEGLIDDHYLGCLPVVALGETTACQQADAQSLKVAGRHQVEVELHVFAFGGLISLDLHRRTAATGRDGNQPSCCRDLDAWQSQDPLAQRFVCGAEPFGLRREVPEIVGSQEHLVGLEAEIQGIGLLQTAREESSADQQDDRASNLRDDQRIAAPARTGSSVATCAGRLERLGEVRAGRSYSR
ncbi:MAG: hypothetical protein MPN21_20285 [Thermoanaerobaculia bacterium]|nr:hypothetical protein [Thermoanaerobaculia bacterium]